MYQNIVSAGAGARPSATGGPSPDVPSEAAKGTTTQQSSSGEGATSTPGYYTVSQSKSSKKNPSKGKSLMMKIGDPNPASGSTVPEDRPLPTPASTKKSLMKKLQL